MDVNLARMPAGTAGWLALVDHCLTLGDLAEVDYLELKGRLSFGERQESKRSAVVLSRAILGMANRMPDLAERHLGGCGVIFVGIDRNRAVVSADAVDAAVLRELVAPYLGDDGPGWDHQFIDHPQGIVLAVIVDAPRWGDPIRTCRRNYSDDSSKLTIRDGEILVRVPGMTRPATSHDVLQLEQRRAKAPHTGALVAVEYAGAFDRISNSNVLDLVMTVVAAHAGDLMDELPHRPTAGLLSSDVQAFLERTTSATDKRTVNEFRAEVEQWQADCEAVANHVATEFLRYALPRGAFVIRNESDRYLEAVRLQVRFPPSAAVLLPTDTDYCDHRDSSRPFQFFQALPESPPRYGALHPYGLDYAIRRAGPQPVTRTRLRADMEVDVTPDGSVVTWLVGDLRPRSTTKADELVAVCFDASGHSPHTDDECEHEALPDTIDASWDVTARGVDHVFQGHVSVSCRQDSGFVMEWTSTSSET